LQWRGLPIGVHGRCPADRSTAALPQRLVTRPHLMRRMGFAVDFRREPLAEADHASGAAREVNVPKRHETTRVIARTSRRALLRSGVGLFAGSIAAQTLSSAASAQDAGDAALVRLQARGGSSSRGCPPHPRCPGRGLRQRRHADRGRQNSRDRRRDRRVWRRGGGRWRQPDRYPGLCRYPQPLVPRLNAQHHAERRSRFRLQPRRPGEALAGLCAAGGSCGAY
jgi:hypothetical protein